MPSLNFGDAPAWLQWLLAVAAVLTFIGGAIRLIPSLWRIATSVITVGNYLKDLPDELTEQREFREKTALTLAQQDTKIADIHHETHFNNGSSIKDATVRIEAGVKGLYKKIEALEEADADMRSDFEKTQPKHPNPRR